MKIVSVIMAVRYHIEILFTWFMFILQEGGIVSAPDSELDNNKTDIIR